MGPDIAIALPGNGAAVLHVCQPAASRRLLLKCCVVQAGRWATKAAGKLPSMLGMHQGSTMATLQLHVQHSLPYASTLVAVEQT